MEWWFLIERMYCNSSRCLALFLLLLIKGYYCNHLSRFTTRGLHNRRNILRNSVRRNRTIYDAVILELLKRRLGISRPSPVSRPVTVDLPSNFLKQQNTQQTRTEVNQPFQQTRTKVNQPSEQTRTEVNRPFQQTRTEVNQPFQQTRTEVNRPIQQTRTEVNQPFQQTNTINEPVRQQTFTRNSAVFGSPLQLMSKLARSSARTQTNNLQQTNNINNDNIFSQSPSQKTKAKNRQTIFGGSVSMGNNGFVFNTANGVRFKIPSKSGSLVIKQGGKGIEFRYMTTPRPRRPTTEEEEIETK